MAVGVDRYLRRIPGLAPCLLVVGVVGVEVVVVLGDSFCLICVVPVMCIASASEFVCGLLFLLNCLLSC